MKDLYITTAIPYVNGSPHLGHALELVQVDALARHRRLRGAAVRSQSGTDDHALKNVTAARDAGLPVESFVAANGDRFLALARLLGSEPDAFLRTSSDPAHRPWVRRLWRACAADLYTRDYAGCYCAGCEQFYDEAELPDGRCPEHGTPPQQIVETNWFFRLSRYRDRVLDLIRTGAVEITPVERRNEVLGFLAAEVHDLSVSRPAARAGGWGVPVPGDESQVVYVWFDALTNYLSGLRDGYDRWWAGDTERVHVIGKGILRFHAVYWIAFLLCAGLPLPTRVLVHDYLTVGGAKIAKSGTQAADPAALARQRGVDALRWWLLRAPAAVGTTDFTVARLVAAYHRDLANSVGNLASRTLALAGRSFGVPADPGVGQRVRVATRELPARIDAALARSDFRAAAEAIIAVAQVGNRLVATSEPWHLARRAESGDAVAAAHFAGVIDAVLDACRVLARELEPFTPDGAARLRAHLESRSLGPAFPRLASTRAD